MKSRKEVNKMQGGNGTMVKLINGNAIDFMKTLKDESIDDTIRDMANYSFLWLASRNLKGNK